MCFFFLQRTQFFPFCLQAYNMYFCMPSIIQQTVCRSFPSPSARPHVFGLRLYNREKQKACLQLLEVTKKQPALRQSAPVSRPMIYAEATCSKSNKNPYLKCHGAIRIALKTCINMPSPLTAPAVQNRTSCWRM